VTCGSNAVSVVCLASCLVTIGCGSSEYVATLEVTVPAAGVIQYRGQPLDFYRLNFIPEGKRPAAAITDADGKFVLGTNTPGDGAVVGRHRVTAEYVGPQVEVEPGKESFVAPPESKVRLPTKYASSETSELLIDIPESGDTNLVIKVE